MTKTQRLRPSAITEYQRVDLSQDVEALRRQVERLSILASDDSSLLLKALLEHSPHGIMVSDELGKLTLHNHAAERIWAGSATTRDFSDWSRYRAFRPDGTAYAAEEWAMARSVRRGETVVAEEVHIERFDGTRGVLLVSCAPIRDSTGQIRGALSLFVDITECRRLGASERADREPLHNLQAVTAALSEAKLPADVAHVVANQMKEVLAADQGVLALATPDEQELVVVAQTGVPADRAVTYHRMPLDVDLPIVRAFRDGRSVWVSSLAQCIEEYPGAPSLNPDVEARACVPIVVDRKKIGVVGFGFAKRHPFTAADRALVESLAHQAGSALERARLYESEQQARARAEELYRFADAAVHAERVEDVYAAALDAITRGLGTPRASILVYDPDGVLRFKAWRGLSEHYRRAVESHSPWTRDTLSPPPVLVPDYEQDAAFAAYHPVFESERIRGLGFIPLLSAGRLLGKFMVYYEAPHRFTPQEIELATAIANHLASVIARFTALASLQETLRLNETFAGVMAHDLRNPLSAVLTTARLLLQRQAGEGERIVNPLNRILSSGNRMLRLIEQLLDFTRIRVGGGIDIEPRTTNLSDVCAQTIGELEFANPGWTIHWTATGNVTGHWDSDRLLQVVSNLVANAGQHGTPGHPILVTADGTGDVVILEVRNAGAVPAGLAAELFDPFRGMRDRAASSRGLGLGLFIVREIVMAHGGRVEVASTEPDGTTVRITLPRLPSRLEAASPTL